MLYADVLSFGSGGGSLSHTRGGLTLFVNGVRLVGSKRRPAGKRRGVVDRLGHGEKDGELDCWFCIKMSDDKENVCLRDPRRERIEMGKKVMEVEQVAV